MTDLVTCRVCGFESPLGTVECPECGAPLPTKAEAPAQPAPAAETPSPAAELTADDTPAEKKPFKLRPTHLVAGLLAVCLLVPMVLLILFKRELPPGAIYLGNGFVTPDGVWDVQAAGFRYVNSTSDGRYFLLEKTGENAASDVKYRGILSSTSLSYAYAPTGEYYLFDGRALEPLEGENMTLTNNGVVFYARSDDNGATLYRRDLNRGKTTKLDRFEGEGHLNAFHCAQDGSAVVYRWSETDEDGEQGGSGYRLWRQGTARPIVLDDIPGDVSGVGNGGKTCLLWSGTVNSSYDIYDFYNLRSNFSLWRDGELTDLPENKILMWANTAYTQFILREGSSDYYGDWYYYAPGETGEPVCLEGVSADYLAPVSRWLNDIKSLKGSFYTAYSSGADKLYYLTNDLTLLLVDEGVEGFSVSVDGKTALYAKNGDIYRAAVDSRGTLAVTSLTNTATDDSDAYDAVGTVTYFSASEDLKHIYYFGQEGNYSNEKTLHHWHDGVDKALDFTANTNYGSIFINVTDSGECYFTYTRNAYYTKGDKPPQLLLEEVGTNASIHLVGETKWPVLMGYRWEDSQNKTVYWLLDGNKLPVELEEWQPEEGKL